MSSKDEERLQKLVERALGTDSIEEARTSALIALKLAAKTGLPIYAHLPAKPGEAPPKRRKRREPPQTPEPRPEPYYPWTRGPAYERTARNPGSPFVNRFAQKPGKCEKCGGGFMVGEVVASRPGSTDSYHAGCASQVR